MGSDRSGPGISRNTDIAIVGHELDLRGDALFKSTEEFIDIECRAVVSFQPALAIGLLDLD